METKDGIQTLFSKSIDDWRNWLSANCQTEKSIILIIYHKKTKPKAYMGTMPLSMHFVLAGLIAKQAADIKNLLFEIHTTKSKLQLGEKEHLKSR